jgi:putative PIN family toxin of toxin-antitoxin system
MRVVVDTNVWVSAVRSRRGASFALLRELPTARFQFGVSVALFLEYRAQLQKAMEAGVTPLSPTQIEAVLAALAHFGQAVPIFFRLRPNLMDESDNMVFECAASFGAPWIVTHNVRDFQLPELKGYGIQPVEPGEFLRMLRSQS